ncbi:hypothetical protein [Evansella cellulosilytica]|uniref:Uncharacterized protein n=1 Tax=Evansella cellulosilytica (strain ATCC 21833 / DSM 2522 / FERM P-1141 / JCM 9156 / N-4) TaxID=649639 RepID=E6TQJ4_EVAC2|nr:hypothetical protein [Evansella cellulosilytica]ADU30505.1 hypothetical protein Bcell_2245 [Evansella cellulosilytica DSM 2522]
MSIDAIIMGIAFICIHLFANDLLPSGRIQRLKWFSFSGGLAVSYVFVYVLPTLHKEQITVKKYSDYLTMESELYFVGLIGLLIFYGIQKVVRKAQKEGENKKARTLFWMQILFFGLYNALVSYTVISHEVLGIQAVFYGLAVGMHFTAVAHDLWREYEDIYNRVGRYVLAAGILMGWIFGVNVSLPPVTETIIFAFISGAMILNVLKYELPPDEEAHFPTFAIGVISYTSITMSLKFFFQW